MCQYCRIEVNQALHAFRAEYIGTKRLKYPEDTKGSEGEKCDAENKEYHLTIMRKGLCF